jgi:hypothetical protein
MKQTVYCACLAALALCAAACAGEPVGRRCFIGELAIDAGTSGTSIVASPALECPSRTCLHTPQERDLPEASEYSDLCTAECSSDDECEKVSESPCQLGFTCAIATTTGPFCCRKLCICKDYLIIPDGGVPLPAACDPENSLNTCPNLAGRSGT